MSETLGYAPKGAEDTRPQPFRVFIPGEGTYGRSLTGLRYSMESTYGAGTYVPASGSAPIEVKKDEWLFKNRYKMRASQIAAIAGGNDIDINGHSAGGWESIDLVNALLDTSWSGKNIDLEFTAPMGFHRGETFKANILEVVRRASRILEYAGEGHHVAYPLPEVYYKAVIPEPRPEGMKVIFEDTADKRSVRRELFFQTLEKTTPDEVTRDALFDQLLRLDERISRAALAKNQAEADRLLKERAEILFPYMEKLQHGEQYPNDLHEKYLEGYNELSGCEAGPKRQQINKMRFLLRNALRLQQGMTKPLADLIKKAQEKGKTITFSFVMLEKDILAPLSSVPGLREQVAARGITPSFQGVKLVETHTHPTIAVWTEATIAIFESAKKK